MEKFDSLLFSSLRTISITRKEKEAFLCDKELVKAIALNDTLIESYNITLRPDDLLKVVRNEATDEVLNKVQDYFSNGRKASRAKTMYTAKQARTIDEATFRFHQMLHYMSTYGVEFFTGEEVSKGWLPYENDCETDITEDATLVKATRYAIIFEDEKYEYVYKKVLGMRNRATIDETTMLKEAVNHVSDETIFNTPVAFKENLVVIFLTLFEKFKGEDRKKAIAAICQNTNDVLKCTEKLLNKKRWNLKTNEKRSIVQIIETFSAKDFESNLMPSNKRREKNLAILKHVDYNTYSRSEEHKKVVTDLRDDNLKSWEGVLKNALAKGDTAKVLKMVASRPGNVVRMANWLIKNGIDVNDLANSVEDKASKFSTQTLIENIKSFSETEKPNLIDNKESLVMLMKKFLKANLKSKETPIKDKKVFIENEGFNLSKSSILFNKKAPSSSFIASGLAKNIDLKDARYIRIFTYWEDAKGYSSERKRVDIDLHGFCRTASGETVHIGWNGHHKNHGVYCSGDVTHSHPYGAEFIDIDLKNTDVELVKFTLNSFTGQPFKDIKNLMVGILPVSGLNETDDKKSAYSPKNCLFYHNLEFDAKSITYGCVDVKNKVLYYDGTLGIESVPSMKVEASEVKFSLEDYLDILIEAQNATIVEKREDADVVLTLNKPNDDSEICLIDENYFADCK